MTDPAFVHIGGAVVCDHGRLSLAEARALSAGYAREAEHWFGAGEIRAARACAGRSAALRKAADAAALWRRAAGWRDPEAADDVLASVPAIKPGGLGARQH